MGMEILAVVRQVLVVLVVRHGDEGAHVGDAHRDQALLERVVQLATQPAMAHIARQVNRRLDRPIVCLAAVERTHIGIAYRTPVQLHHQIRIALERTLDAPGELLNARHLVFAGNRRLAHIRLIDGKQRRRIIGRRQANRRLGHLGHTTLLPQKQRPPCAKPSARRPLIITSGYRTAANASISSCVVAQLVQKRTTVWVSSYFSQYSIAACSRMRAMSSLGRITNCWLVGVSKKNW